MKTGWILGGLLAGFATCALGDGVAVTPGQWEMTMTMEMSMMPAPQTRTYTECVEESELGPDQFDMDEDNPCEYGSVQVDGNTIRWTISCPGPMGAMEGQWEFTSSGDAVTGSGNMTADMGGQSLDFTMDWDGRRIGDCDQ